MPHLSKAMVFRPRSVTTQLTARTLNSTEVATNYLLAYGLALKRAPALFKRSPGLRLISLSSKNHLHILRQHK